MKRSVSASSHAVAGGGQPQNLASSGQAIAPTVAGSEQQQKRGLAEARMPPSRTSSGGAPNPAVKVDQGGTSLQLGDDGVTAASHEHQPSQPTNSQPSDADDARAVAVELSDYEDEELRKLDEDFQKNLQRAKKVFDNRMDNLQRSQIEREAQHQKTLEKHQKERAEFEKRLQQEEKEQHRRIEQLQREWDRRREVLSKNKRKVSEDEGSVSAEVSLSSSPETGYAMAEVANEITENSINHAMSNDSDR